MPTAPRRHWFSFSLLTLFVLLTLIGVWLGYYANWISQRRDARAWLGMQMNGGSFGYHPKPESSFPWMLRLLGEKPTSVILMRHEFTDHYDGFFPLPDEYVRLVERVERLFPEAVVMDLTSKELARKSQDNETEQLPELESQP